MTTTLLFAGMTLKSTINDSMQINNVLPDSNKHYTSFVSTKITNVAKCNYFTTPDLPVVAQELLILNHTTTYFLRVMLLYCTSHLSRQIPKRRRFIRHNCVSEVLFMNGHVGKCCVDPVCMFTGG